MSFNDLDDQQLRGAINLCTIYDGWVQDARILERGKLRWKHSNGHDYLYRMTVGGDTGTSLGARSQDNEALFEEGKLREQRVAQTEKNMLIKARLYRTLGLPVIDGFAAKVLRELDIAGLLGESIRVVGSCALPAYELEANTRLPAALSATEDFDMAWVGRDTTRPAPVGLLSVMKKADATWTVLEDRGFQLRNNAGQMIDIITAPELVAGYPQRERWRALPVVGQEYLLGGTPVSQVVSDTRGQAARIVAPDPRLFALHKFYLAGQDGRGNKQAKDIAQAEALMELIETRMPHYPLDEEFQETLPLELLGHLDRWRARPQTPSIAKAPGRKS